MAVASETFYNLVDRRLRKAVARTRTNVAGYDSALGTQADSIFADDLPTGAADRNNLTFALVNRETDSFRARHVSLNPPCESQSVVTVGKNYSFRPRLTLGRLRRHYALRKKHVKLLLVLSKRTRCVI